MKLTQATVGRKVNYVSRKHSGSARITEIQQTAKGPYFRLKDADRDAYVSVRLSQIELPPKVSK